MTPTQETFVLLAKASSTAECPDQPVKIAVIPLSPTTVASWESYAREVRRMMVGDPSICSLSLWTVADFYTDLPVSTDDPYYDKALEVLDANVDWTIVPIDSIQPGRKVRTECGQLDVWGANLVFSGQHRYVSEKYETGWIRVDSVARAYAAIRGAE